MFLSLNRGMIYLEKSFKCSIPTGKISIEYNITSPELFVTKKSKHSTKKRKGEKPLKTLKYKHPLWGIKTIGKLSSEIWKDDGNPSDVHTTVF